MIWENLEEYQYYEGTYVKKDMLRRERTRMLKVHIKKQLPGFCLDIAFEHDKGCLGILGASGAGKSMTLKCIAGIETPDEGYIILNDRVLFDSEKKINLMPQQRRVGYMFQNYALFPNMTVEENIGAGIKDKKEKKQEVKLQIERFQLQGFEKHFPSQLSGGQQQRVAMARLMAHKPELLLLDEPFSAMDGYLKEKLQHDMMGFLKEYSNEVLLVSHSRDDIYRFCPRVLAVDAGNVLQEGSLWQIFSEPVNYKVARLTGCNNISPAEKVNEYEVYAKDWDIRLKTEKPVTEEIRYVGIRSHDIKVGEQDAVAESRGMELALREENSLEPDERKDRENCFAMELLDVVESPFEYKYHMKAAGSNATEAIWWKAYKDLELDAAPESFPRSMVLPKGKLLLLKA